MTSESEILDRIGRGRTDLVFELLRLPDWRGILEGGPVRVLQWFVYYDDVTAMKAILEAFMRDVRTAGETPLHRAAAYAGSEIIEYLLEHGADREARDARRALIEGSTRTRSELRAALWRDASAG